MNDKAVLAALLIMHGIPSQAADMMAEAFLDITLWTEMIDVKGLLKSGRKALDDFEMDWIDGEECE